MSTFRHAGWSPGKDDGTYSWPMCVIRVRSGWLDDKILETINYVDSIGMASNVDVQRTNKGLKRF